MRRRHVLLLCALAGCTEAPREEDGTSSTPTSASASATATATDGSSTSGPGPSSGSSGERLDLGDPDTPPPGPPQGCDAVDFLFVVDNSESMATYQMRLTEQFPDFIDAMYAALPEQVSVHVGLTTTDFDAGCSAPEATAGCQSAATLEDIQSHYRRPDEDPDGGNGTQGRLFEFGGRTYFESSSDDDPAALSAWFADAALAAGEEGCSFEMPVAAAGFAAHPANAPSNGDFIRDAGGLLVLFFLTDEPDKSVESRTVYEQMLLDAKTECGGRECIFVGGLIPGCTQEINQKLWQFITLFDEEPSWSDISQTNDYTAAFGETLAQAIADRCAMLTPAG